MWFLTSMFHGGGAKRPIWGLSPPIPCLAPPLVAPHSINKRWARSCMVPVSWQSAHRWLSHKPGGRLPLLSTRPAVTFTARDHPPPLAGTKFTAWWQRHTGVSSLPKATTRWYHAGTRTRNLWIASPMPHQQRHSVTDNLMDKGKWKYFQMAQRNESSTALGQVNCGGEISDECWQRD